jgi:hypothetical protein
MLYQGLKCDTPSGGNRFGFGQQIIRKLQRSLHTGEHKVLWVNGKSMRDHFVTIQAYAPSFTLWKS